MSPEQDFEAKFSAALDKKGILGFIPFEGFETDDGGKKKKVKPGKKFIKELYGQEISSALRAVMVTTGRNQAIRKGLMFATLDQYDKGSAWFNTRSGNAVVYGLADEIKECMSEKAMSQNFDRLFGLTFALTEYTFWLYDNELWEEGGKLEKAIELLGSSWKELLSQSDHALGITEEFTRPGILKLLEKMSKNVDSLGDLEIKIRFKYN